MAQRLQRADQFHRANIYAFPGSHPAPDEAITALNLVYQAADIFRGLQDRARETEARAQSLCSEASEKLRRAEMKAEAAEQAYRALMAAVDQKLKDASRAHEQAQASLMAQTDKRTAAEARTQQAEAETREAKRALVSVEEAIRKRLLAPDSLRDRDELTAVA
jgi:chromosome segregation ATPase